MCFLATTAHEHATTSTDERALFYPCKCHATFTTRASLVEAKKLSQASSRFLLRHRNAY